ncbi:MAG: acetyl-CoA carboxylase biotin carboxyl carrier protein [Lachnospiraceae bacterium]|nr:acetyl-CoA carboxylase biotin carboxyl carrier protein [Lachnospiraceae bacterium]MDE6254291.1 acetyl-CoA carboxylase biotin carboxyl carrier protein [Lachnospiraceae bacterium]
MEHQQIIDIIKAVSSSKLSSFEYEEGNVYINMTVQSDKVAPPDTTVSYVVADKKEVVKANEYDKKEDKTEQDKVEDGQVVKSPLVGTFYSASSPDAEKFVKVGDRVSKGQTLGIIEAMKLMNEIESEYDGIVAQILVENKQVVEYGQPLFIIKED